MTGSSSRWTCNLCDETVAMTHKGHHRKYKCPLQGTLLRARQRQEKAIAEEAAREAERLKAKEEAKPPPPKFWQYLPCLCRCGEQLGQVKGQRKKQFVNHEHYDAWRREAVRKAAGDLEPVEDRKHAQEVAALVAKQEAIAREAEAVRLLTPDASYALWGACLGVAL